MYWLHPTHQRQLGSTTVMYATDRSLDQLSFIFEKLREGADQEFLVELRRMPFRNLRSLRGSLWSRVVLSLRPISPQIHFIRCLAILC